MENISLTGKVIRKRTTETGWGGVRGRDGRRKEDRQCQRSKSKGQRKKA